jgi:hypothetical protein
MTDYPAYPAYPDDERSDRVRALGWPHRYRGGRLMLLRHAPPDLSVIRLRRMWMQYGQPFYNGETLGGGLVTCPEAQIVPPDEAPLVAALLRERGNPGPALLPETTDALGSSYVWMSWTGDPTVSDAAAFGIASDPWRARWHSRGESLGAARSWSSRDVCIAEAIGSSIVRVPFIAACRIATGFAGLGIDAGAPTQLNLDRRTVEHYAIVLPDGPPTAV